VGTISAETVIPHRSPMRMLDVLVDWNEESAKGEVVFGAGHLAIDNGLVREAALVECMAQTVAAMEGAKTAAGGGPGGTQVGMLCGVSDFVVMRRPAAGERLEIGVRVQKRLGPMLLVDGQIVCDGRVVASGSLKLSV
jgi:predicted hotdog family 3-hydroxylacyl-ACP dehydratase